jgi:hypothetical protein
MTRVDLTGRAKSALVDFQVPRRKRGFSFLAATGRPFLLEALMIADVIPLRVSIPRACEALDFSRAKLYLLIKSGELHPHKDGARTYFAPAELQRYVDMRAAG